jgi:hypothetical protein
MRIILLLSLLVSGCATTWSQLGYEKVGPVEAEIWRNNKTGSCERRVYLDSMYFHTVVNCDDYKARITQDVRGYAFPSDKREAETKSISRSNTRTISDGIR